MPINKDLSVSPYFDDFDADKNFYKVLFKPGVAVQVRELNQLQTILQDQVEKFGNNIYKRGTIIDGVNFIYYPNYAYVKINDSQLNGQPAVPTNYVSHFVVDPTSNLTAHIVNSADGFESTDPDLKTVYLRYINSGNSGNATAFSAGSILKVYDYLDSVHFVTITNGSSGFANNDAVVFVPALEITLSTNTTFTVGETISQTGSTKFGIVTAVSTVNSKQVLQIRPRTTDLSNTAISANIWQFSAADTIIGATSGATATVVKPIGFGASAIAVTTADIGKVVGINIVSGGEGYYVSPYVSIKSSGSASTVGARNYTDLSLAAQNFVAQITVSNKAGSVGRGYAFGVTEGVIYQKGHFVRVEPQTIIVSKHSPAPNALSVGFTTYEDVIDSNIDQSLLDLSTGTTNQFAPGADRLRLTPRLTVLDTEEANGNEEFLSIVDFSEGRAFRERRRTQFNTIMDEMATRTHEQSGAFVLNEFLVTTKSTANTLNEGQFFNTVVDPGKGYIDGYRVETVSNYSTEVTKGTDSRIASNISSAIDYGNYILITNVAGRFNCNIGAQVSLMNGATSFPLNSTYVNAGTIVASGSVVGLARARNFVYESGEPGTASAVYRLYLFDIRMNAGKSFRDHGGVWSPGFAIADTVKTFDATANANISKLYDTDSGSSLIIPTGSDATKNISNLNYVYRTTNDTLSMANTGITSLLLSASEEYYAYESASLTDNEKRTLTLIPDADMILMPNTALDGTATVTSGSNTITISAASVNKFDLGDFVAVYSAPSTYVMRRVTAKTATTLQFDLTLTFTNGTASFSRALPKLIPVALHSLTGATVTTTGGGKTLNINLGLSIDKAAATTCALTYDVEVRNATPSSKTADRNNFVKLDILPGKTAGPWCLGIPDIFRLKKVFLSNASTVNTNSTDVTEQFYIDHNQTADYYGNGYLYKRNDANILLDDTTWLLVQFDAFTSTAGVYTINSYVSSNEAQRFADDSLALAALGTKVNSFEVPEVYTSAGKYHDLLNCIDFRPAVTPTAAYAKTAAAATTNPAETVTFSGTSKKFPLPETAAEFNREYFMGRKDVVVVTKDNLIKVVRGTPATNPKDAKVPTGVLLLNKLTIPAYPCVPMNFSRNTKEILDRKMSNEKYLIKRIRDKTIKTEVGDDQKKLAQPRGYTMADIGKLDRRVKDLEYNVALSLVESDLKDKVIPSIASPNLNRFKFGFFVDDYSSDKHSDTVHPEYNCDVVDSMVVPISLSTGTPHGPSDPSSGEAVGQFELIRQDMASVQPPPPPPPPPPPAPDPLPAPTTPVPAPAPSPPPAPTPPGQPPAPTPAPTFEPAPTTVVAPAPVVTAPTPTPAPVAPPPTPVITAKLVKIYRSHVTTNRAINSDTGWLTFSSVPSTFTLEYDFGGSVDKLGIEKRNAAGVVSVVAPFVDTIKKGVISIPHDPSTGREYRVSVKRKSSTWEYTLTYPIDDTVYVEPTAPSVNGGTVFYDGALIGMTPGTFLPQTLGQNFGELAYGSIGLTHRVKIASLKPLTTHNVTLTDSSQIVTVNANIGTGSAVTTDASGVAEFDLLIDLTTLDNVASLGGASYTNNIAPVFTVNVVSSDFTSGGTFMIRVDGDATGTGGGAGDIGQAYREPITTNFRFNNLDSMNVDFQ